MGSTSVRTPAARFDDIPGELPFAQVPADAALSSIGREAVVKLQTLREDDFAEGAIWRDLLAYTGTYRTLHSVKSVIGALLILRQSREPFDFKHRVGKEQVASHGSANWVDVDYVFKTRYGKLIGQCAGTVSVIKSENGEWKIWMLRTWLENFVDHGHPDILELDHAISDSIGGKVSSEGGRWYNTIIVGGSQAGLSAAGRLKALGVSYIVLEKNKEIGETWASRYDTLSWHTSKE